MALQPNSGALMWTGGGYGLPRIELPGGRQIDRPHPEWALHQLRWRWLLDSWEGGEAYRQAVYGLDLHGMPIRNLVRHKREYPAPDDGGGYPPTAGRPDGTDQAAQATDDDYELRRARTPVPTFVAECVEIHLARIYHREVAREGPEDLVDWWTDVDGQGTPIDSWMADTIAPLLLVLGQLDLVVDAPPIPAGEEVRSRADEVRLGLDRPVASYILPENLVWWTLERGGGYRECLVREVADDGAVRWRYWSAAAWALYDARGNPEGPVTPHPYGRVPIVRVFDRRRPRCRNIGLPRYESVAELQREYYNRDSELILSDTTQAHPLLQGPEDYVQPDGTVPIGPNWLLPKKKNSGGGAASYEGFDVIDFPKGGADSIRTNKQDLRDAVDRAACLTKPAGAAGTDGGTVSQSGVSKQIDASTGNDLLGRIAAVLQRCEDQLAALYLMVKGGGSPAQPPVIQYPREFDLAAAADLADVTNRVQLILQTAGVAPAVEERLISRLLKAALPGLDDDDYAAMDADVGRVLAAGAAAAPSDADADTGTGTGTNTGIGIGTNLNSDINAKPSDLDLEDEEDLSSG